MERNNRDIIDKMHIMKPAKNIIIPINGAILNDSINTPTTKMMKPIIINHPRVDRVVTNACNS